VFLLAKKRRVPAASHLRPSLGVQMNARPTIAAAPRIDDALSTLKGVFLEVPSVVLSVNHASRLTGLDEQTCLALLLALEQAKFLWRSRSGRFLLRADWSSTES
jgi:hypothetical protein